MQHRNQQVQETTRRFTRRLKLYSLLALVLALTIGLSWFGGVYRKAQKQRDAVIAIEMAGGRVVYQYEVSESGNPLLAPPLGPPWLRALFGDDLFNRVHTAKLTDTGSRVNDLMPYLSDLDDLRSIALSGTPVTDENLVYLRNLTSLERLRLGDTAVSDSGLRNCEDLTRMRILALSRTKVTDDGLAYLERMVGLEFLMLGGTQITDRGLEHLRNMPNLKFLELSVTHVTDAGLTHLEKLENLTDLELNLTHVTDGGLSHLAKLKKLRFLLLRATPVTDSGVARLEQSLPDCSIINRVLFRVDPEDQGELEEHLGPAPP